MKTITNETETLDLNKLLFRASSMGDIMVGVKKGWSVNDSLTCKRKLVQMYREHTWKRRSDKGNKYTEKGTAQEEDSTTLYSRLKKYNFKQNKIRLNNDFFTGEIDLFKGEEITKAEETIDIKTSWDWTTFPSICDSVNDDYVYQGNVYMDLSGAKKHTVASCLVNTPPMLIMDEKRRLAYKMGIMELGEEPEEYIAKCIEIEKNHIYDMELFKKHNPFFDFHCKEWKYDIPMNQRVHEIVTNRDNALIAKMKNRIIECRAWLVENEDAIINNRVKL